MRCRCRSSWVITRPRPPSRWYVHLLPDDLPEPSWLDLLLPPSHEEHANRRERECDTQSLISVPASPLREDINVPDRFEGLADVGSGALRMIVSPVGEALDLLDRRFADMRAANRGGLMILRGESGAGKSTFLNTVGLFRRDVVTERIAGGADVPEALSEFGPATAARVVVLEGREALGEVAREALEAAMHAINSFVRSANGRDTLVVWPTNTDDLNPSSDTVFLRGDRGANGRRSQRGRLARLAWHLGGAGGRANGPGGHSRALPRVHPPGGLLDNGARIRQLLVTEQYRQLMDHCDRRERPRG